MTRTEWILGILLAVLLIFIVVMAVIFWFRPEGGSNLNNVPVAPTSEFVGQTAVQAYLFAQTEAIKWQPDASLLKATATWPQGATRETLLQGTTTWNFSYYSPGSQMTANVSVVEETATLGATRAVEAALATVNTSGWNIDSNEAIQKMLSTGGDQFLNTNGVSTLTASLAANAGEHRTEWFLSLFAVGNGNSYTVSIDATSGEILTVIQTP